MRNQMSLSAGKMSFSLLAIVSGILLTLLPTASQGATFWVDTFDDGVLSDTWDINSCGANPPSDGCDARIASDIARSGNMSLKSTYHPTCTTCQQGTFYDRTFPSSAEVWTRTYIYTTNFTYDAGAGSKYVYLHNLTMSYPNFFLINWFGSRQMGASSQIEAGMCPNGTSGPYDSCAYHPNMASVNLNDNQWYCLESHIKMNTPGQPDGLIEMFVDGVQTLGYYNRTFRGPNTTNGPQNNNYGAFAFNAIRHYTQHGAGNRYTDDLAVGNTRIGCSGSGGSVDTTAPRPPIGLAVR